ncbi:MAG TPA: asparagine synthase (glutamine-hydrolyzing), partial [Vicinamibacterales bacterium]|nr:asparagine synthase (glutamine-hydrolyzing) [Vicinamibacterales bacterium]
MCGIVAAVSKEGGLSADVMERAVRRLHHRGPDGQRVWVSDDRRAALGHARLSIIDLATGDQPIANEDERLRIVVNGEFYDFERARDALTRSGHSFRTKSDSEIALHLYEDRGAHAVHALRGEFAFALWDDRDRTLFAARDRFGIKPLYYTVHEGACYLASEVKAFLELGVPLAWDRETLFDTHAMFMAHAPDRTLFAGVYQLPPGHFLFTDGERVRVEEYWDWDFPIERVSEPEPEASAEREWIERLRETLGDAIRLRLRADVPVACYLSGGIDSSAVLGMAANCSPRPLQAFTLSFDHADYDEAPIAEETAKRAGAEYCRIDVRSAQLADDFADTVYHAERPIGNAHSVAKFMLSRAVRDSGVKVVLTGEGGDEIFAGYPEVRQDLETVNRGGVPPKQPFPALDGVRRLLGYVPTNAAVWANFGAGLQRVMDRGFLTAFNG